MTRHVDGPPRALESKDSATVQQPGHVFDGVRTGAARQMLHAITLGYAEKYRRAVFAQQLAGLKVTGLQTPSEWAAYESARNDAEMWEGMAAYALMAEIYGDNWFHQITAEVAEAAKGIDAAQVKQ